MRNNYNIHVSIEPKHISYGIREDWDRCPVALAINDCLKSQYSASVGKESRGVISIELDNNREDGKKLCHFMVRMDSKSIEFTNKFDRNEKVEPTIFVLSNVPVKMIKNLE